MNASTRIVSVCNHKIHDVCNLAALRTVVISIVGAIPLAVGVQAALDRLTGMPEEFHIVAALLVVLCGLSVGSFAAGRYLKQKPRDFDETRVWLITYFSKRDAVVGENWKTFLSQPKHCPPTMRRRAWHKVSQLDLQGYPGLVEKVGPSVNFMLLVVLVSVSVSLLIAVGARHYDATHAAQVEVKAAVSASLWNNSGDAGKTAKAVAERLGVKGDRARQLQSDFEAGLKDAKSPADKLDRLVAITRKVVPAKEKAPTALTVDPTPTLTMTVLLAVGVLLIILTLTLAAQWISYRIHAPRLEAPEEIKPQEPAQAAVANDRLPEPSVNGRVQSFVQSA